MRRATIAGAVAAGLLAMPGPALGQEFRERSPGLIRDCIEAAIAEGGDMVSETADSHKYMCTGDPAERFWDFLGTAGGEHWLQQTETEGAWDSRGFPLGGCYRQVRDADGTPATDGLSCSVWIPRAVPGE